MNCVVLQPSYIPWRGYFHQIYKADTFVFYDDAQFDRGGWRNRNRVKTPSGSRWLTIPVLKKGSVNGRIPIHQIQINWDQRWNVKHLRTLRHLYSKAPHFEEYICMIEEFYGQHPNLLADFTIDLTVALSKKLGIDSTQFRRSSTLKVFGSRTDRLVSILQAVGATHYISGPSAKGYLDEKKLLDAGISFEYMSYDYPYYEQLYPPFDPRVSILDLLFMVGREAPDYIWGSRG